MGTCVSSSETNNNSNSNGVAKGNKESEENNLISKQQRQYGLFQRMARQQQQIMEEMEDGVETSFIDLILLHLDGLIKR
jgi:hypothetical protein